jgi:hypothetical protein
MGDAEEVGSAKLSELLLSGVFSDPSLGLVSRMPSPDIAASMPATESSGSSRGGERTGLDRRYSLFQLAPKWLALLIVSSMLAADSSNSS